MIKINSRNYLSEVEAVSGTWRLSEFPSPPGSKQYWKREMRLLEFIAKPKREEPSIRLDLNSFDTTDSIDALIRLT